MRERKRAIRSRRSISLTDRIPRVGRSNAITYASGQQPSALQADGEVGGNIDAQQAHRNHHHEHVTDVSVEREIKHRHRESENITKHASRDGEVGGRRETWTRRSASEWI